MKHTITVSKCCGADIKNAIKTDYEPCCSYCGKRVNLKTETKLIVCIPEEEIVKVGMANPMVISKPKIKISGQG